MYPVKRAGNEKACFGLGQDRTRQVDCGRVLNGSFYRRSCHCTWKTGLSPAMYTHAHASRAHPHPHPHPHPRAISHFPLNSMLLGAREYSAWKIYGPGEVFLKSIHLFKLKCKRLLYFFSIFLKHSYMIFKTCKIHLYIYKHKFLSRKISGSPEDKICARVYRTNTS